MGRLIKWLALLALLGAGALTIYALVAELPPPTREIVVDVPAPALR